MIRKMSAPQTQNGIDEGFLQPLFAPVRHSVRGVARMRRKQPADGFFYFLNLLLRLFHRKGRVFILQVRPGQLRKGYFQGNGDLFQASILSETSCAKGFLFQARIFSQTGVIFKIGPISRARFLIRKTVADIQPLGLGESDFSHVRILLASPDGWGQRVENPRLR